MEESVTMHDLVVGQCSLIDLIPTISLGELDVDQEKVQVQRGRSLVDRLGKRDQCQTACIIASDKQALEGDHVVTARTTIGGSGTLSPARLFLHLTHNSTMLVGDCIVE